VRGVSRPNYPFPTLTVSGFVDGVRGTRAGRLLGAAGLPATCRSLSDNPELLTGISHRPDTAGDMTLHPPSVYGVNGECSGRGSV